MVSIRPESYVSKNKLASLLTNRYFILSFILSIGIFLRLCYLTDKSLWYDEACSLSFADYNWKDLLGHRYMSRPLYFVILKIWVGLFGSSEFMARLLSVGFGIAAIILIYKLVELLYGKNSGLLSAFLISISPYHIYYSQQVRNYTLFLCLGLISMIIFIRLLDKEKLIQYVLYLLINGLMVYTHPFGVYVILTQVLYFLIISKKLKFKIHFLIAHTLLVIFSLFFLVWLSKKVGNSINNEISYITTPNFKSLLETLEVFSYGGYRQAHGGIGFQSSASRLLIPRILTVFFSCLFIFCLLPNKKNQSTNSAQLSCRNKDLFFFLWLFLPIGITYLFSVIIKPIYLNRYFFVTSVAFYVIIAKAITLLPNIRVRILSILLVVILTINCLGILYKPGSNADWKKVVKYAMSNIKQGDVIMLVPIMQIVPFWYYYKYKARSNLADIDKFGKKINNKWNVEFLDGDHVVSGFAAGMNKDYIESRITDFSARKNNICLVISPYWVGSDFYQEIISALKGRYILKGSQYFAYSGVEVDLYTLR